MNWCQQKHHIGRITTKTYPGTGILGWWGPHRQGILCLFARPLEGATMHRDRHGDPPQEWSPPDQSKIWCHLHHYLQQISAKMRQQVDMFCYDEFIFITEFILIVYDSSLEYYYHHYQGLVEQIVHIKWTLNYNKDIVLVFLIWEKNQYQYKLNVLFQRKTKSNKYPFQEPR